MADALVVGLGDAVRALRARATLVRLLSAYSWFIGGRVELRSDGEVILVALTTEPSDPVRRAAILARVAAHLDGVRVDDRYQTSEKNHRTRGPKPVAEADKEHQ